MDVERGTHSSAIAHHIWRHDAEAQADQQRDLVAPAEAEVGPAVDL